MNLSNIQSIWQKTEQRSSETESSTVRKAEDVVSSMLAKGYVLSKDALNVAKTFDERHQLLSNASATVASLDRQIGLSDKISAGTALVSGKMREVDERFQVSTFRGGGVRQATVNSNDFHWIFEQGPLCNENFKL
jgi:oligoendopeptidase F